MRRVNLALAVPVILAAMLILTGTVRASTYTFTPIEFPGTGDKYTIPMGINDSGDIVGYYNYVYNVHSLILGFLYSGGTYTTLPAFYESVASNSYTYPCGINDSGQIVGYFNGANGYNSWFLYSDTGNSAPDGSWAISYAYGINGNGEVVGLGYLTTTGNYESGFVFNNGNYMTINAPDSPYGTCLVGINDNDQIVGYTPDSTGHATSGFQYSGGTFTNLEYPNATGPTVPAGINDNGDIVGSYTDAVGNSHGFLYSGGNYTRLDDPNAGIGSFQGTVVNGINNNGDIVGYYIDSNRNYHGFLATPIVNGSCGPADGQSFISAPASHLCSAGTASAVSGTGPWTWTCRGANGGTSASCSADISPVNGACGSCNGGTFTSAPTSNLCSAGTASVVSGTGPWIWTCQGANGGTNANCSANVSPTGGLWQNATPTGGGWYYLSPFGAFSTNGSPWIYLETLGWLYAVGTSTDSLWFYDPQWDGNGGWWWTSSSLFPWVYSATESEWLYYDATDSTPGARWFFAGGGQASNH